MTGFYIRALDFTDQNYREADLAKLMSGVRNNYPALFPVVSPSANEERRMLRHLGQEKPRDMFLEDVPVAAMPVGVEPHFRYFARKLTAAVFYRLQGSPLTSSHFWMCRWFPSYDESLDDVISTFAGKWNHLIVGARANVDFGDQFSVLAATARDDDVTTFIAQFGTSLCFWCSAGKPQREELRSSWESYTPIKEGMSMAVRPDR